MAFKIAGSMAFKEAMRKADPVLTEPIMKVVVIVPEEYMGDVIGDMNSRRGQIQSMEATQPGIQEITANVPLSEMFGYATDLRSKTQGRGSLLHGAEPLRRSSEVYLRADYFEESEQLIYLKPNYLLLHFKEEYSNGKS